MLTGMVQLCVMRGRASGNYTGLSNWELLRKQGLSEAGTWGLTGGWMRR